MDETSRIGNRTELSSAALTKQEAGSCRNVHFLQFGSEEERATFADACGGEARYGGRRRAQRVALMVSEIAGLGAQDTDTVSVPSVAAPFGPLSNSKQTPVLVWSMVDPGAKEMQVRSRVGDRRESGLVVLNPRLVAVDPERTLPAIASAPLR